MHARLSHAHCLTIRVNCHFLHMPFCTTIPRFTQWPPLPLPIRCFVPLWAPIILNKLNNILVVLEYCWTVPNCVPGNVVLRSMELAREATVNLFGNFDYNLPPTAIIEVLQHCLSNYFQFGNCRQVKSTPMGSPMSGHIFKAVLQRLERWVFAVIAPKFWERFVDDTSFPLSFNSSWPV